MSDHSIKVVAADVFLKQAAECATYSLESSKLTRKQLTEAVRKYARKHGFSASTVRACTSLKLAAVAEWRIRIQ